MFKEIARELPDLLDQQLQAILGRSFEKLSSDEKIAYESRKRRILELREVLDQLRRR